MNDMILRRNKEFTSVLIGTKKKQTKLWTEEWMRKHFNNLLFASDRSCAIAMFNALILHQSIN